LPVWAKGTPCFDLALDVQTEKAPLVQKLTRETDNWLARDLEQFARPRAADEGFPWYVGRMEQASLAKNV
jgi:hypothetical protein